MQRSLRPTGRRCGCWLRRRAPSPAMDLSRPASARPPPSAPYRRRTPRREPIDAVARPRRSKPRRLGAAARPRRWNLRPLDDDARLRPPLRWRRLVVRSRLVPQHRRPADSTSPPAVAATQSRPRRVPPRRRSRRRRGTVAAAAPNGLWTARSNDGAPRTQRRTHAQTRSGHPDDRQPTERPPPNAHPGTAHRRRGRSPPTRTPSGDVSLQAQAVSVVVEPRTQPRPLSQQCLVRHLDGLSATRAGRGRSDNSRAAAVPIDRPIACRASRRARGASPCGECPRSLAHETKPREQAADRYLLARRSRSCTAARRAVRAPLSTRPVPRRPRSCRTPASAGRTARSTRTATTGARPAGRRHRRRPRATRPGSNSTPAR